MLDPRLYRTGLIAVVLAAIVVAFSLYDQEGPLGATLAPAAFNGQNAEATMTALATTYRTRPPGSTADRAIAGEVDSQLTRYGFIVSRDFFTAKTPAGPRRLENVIGVRPGVVSGSVVIVTHRDATGAAAAGASGTGVLLELGRVLSGETQDRTIVLASTSGSAGAAGATRLARTLAPPVDAVIALGDLAGTRVRQPVVVPWSSSQQVAPTMLRNTVAAALSAQAAPAPEMPSLAAQLAHLAFPVSVSEQGPFGARGDPAVLLSLSGERPPPANEPTSGTQINALGRSVLQAINALDGASGVPAPSAYLIWNGKVVPAWAIRLLALALMLPVLIATVDGLARARRRGSRLAPWIVWVLASALPFALVVLVAFGAEPTGLTPAAPPGALAGDEVSLHGGGIAVLALAAAALAVGFGVVRRQLVRFLGPRGSGSRHGSSDTDSRRTPYGPGAPAAVMVVLCAVSLLIWLGNPFAALLVVPALHAWLWAVDANVRIPAPIRFVLVLAGAAAPALVALYYAQSLGLGFVGAAWEWVLLLAGGTVSPAVALEWSVVLGCLVSVVLIVVRAALQPSPRQLPVTIRGPIGYAGPGSLGGTESALRR